MKKYIIEIDETGTLFDKNNINTGIVLSSYQFEEYKDSSNISELMALGATPDDLLKLKAAGVI